MDGDLLSPGEPDRMRQRPPDLDPDGFGLFAPLDWLRPLTLLAVVATLLGRATAGSLRGALVGFDAGVESIELLGSWLSQLLLLAEVVLLIGATLSVLRLGRLPLAFRLVATGLAGVALGLAARSASARLPPELSEMLAGAVILMGLLGTAQAVVMPHTRVVGVMLGLVSLGALTRQVAWAMAVFGGERAIVRLSHAARVVSTGAVLLQGAAVTLALLWLATRRRRVASVWTTLALSLAMLASWLGERVERTGLSPWKATVVRASYRLLSLPAPLLPVGVRIFLAVLALLLAVVAVCTRRERGSVVSILALVLLSGLDADVPLCALGLAVASLAAALTAHDPRAVPSPGAAPPGER